jgi:hypothetical protein
MCTRSRRSVEALLVAAHPATHHGRPPAGIGHRSGRHRPLARACQPDDHASILEANLAAKEAVLQRLADPAPAKTRFRPGDRLLAFLETH